MAWPPRVAAAQSLASQERSERNPGQEVRARPPKHLRDSTCLPQLLKIAQRRSTRAKETAARHVTYSPHNQDLCFDLWEMWRVLRIAGCGCQAEARRYEVGGHSVR